MESLKAERRSGQSGSDRSVLGASLGCGGKSVRAAGHPHQQTPRVSDVLLHEASEHCRPGGRVLSGLASTYLGHHLPLLWSGRPVQVGQIPAGSRHVRVHLHAGGHVRGQVFSHMPAAALFAHRETPLPHRDLVDPKPGVQHPSDLHLLPAGGGRRGARLLGGIRSAVGRQGLHHVDEPRHLHHSGRHTEHLLWLDHL